MRYTVSEKFQTVSFDLYSSVMGITGLGLVWRAAAKTYDVSALPGEVFLATGLAVFLVLTGIQLLRLVFCRQIILAEWHSRASKNFFCAATISGFLLAMGLLPYSILLAKVLWIAAVAAQIFFLTCTFRRWLIDQLDTHEISPVWLIPMVGNASPAFAGVDLGFPGLSKMLLFSALLCWALFMPLILWRIVFVRPVTPQKAMPGLAIMVSAPAVIAVGLYCIYGGMNDVIEFMAWTALFFAIVLISLWRRMIPDTFGRIWWGFTFPSTALASALIRVDAASMTTLNHTLALAALTFATFVVCSIIVMTVRQSLLTLCWGRHAKHSR
ncbi:TPA: C4-dicarboxylate transporter [Klebsiella pneumoniae]